MPITTLTSKGQITLPKQIRDAFRLKPGDPVEFLVARDGGVSVRAPRGDVRDLKGLLRSSRRRTMSLEDMERAIARRGDRT